MIRVTQGMLAVRLLLLGALAASLSAQIGYPGGGYPGGGYPGGGRGRPMGGGWPMGGGTSRGGADGARPTARREEVDAPQQQPAASGPGPPGPGTTGPGTTPPGTTAAPAAALPPVGAQPDDNRPTTLIRPADPPPDADDP